MEVVGSSGFCCLSICHGAFGLQNTQWSLFAQTVLPYDIFWALHLLLISWLKVLLDICLAPQEECVYLYSSIFQ